MLGDIQDAAAGTRSSRGAAFVRRILSKAATQLLTECEAHDEELPGLCPFDDGGGVGFNVVCLPAKYPSCEIRMDTPSKCIYALFFDRFDSPQDLQEGPTEVTFYVGRTTDPERRLREHRYAAKHGTEDKYVYIRELQAKNLSWDLKVLRTVDASDNRPWEFLYVIDLIRQGASLKNMRYGDFQTVPENRLRRIAADTAVRTIDQLEARLAADEQADAEPKYERSRDVQLRAILRSLRWKRVETDSQGRKWNFYDQGDGTNEVKAEFYTKKNEVAELLLPPSEEVQLLIRRFLKR